MGSHAEPLLPLDLSRPLHSQERGNSNTVVFIALCNYTRRRSNLLKSAQVWQLKVLIFLQMWTNPEVVQLAQLRADIAQSTEGISTPVLPLTAAETHMYSLWCYPVKFIKEIKEQREERSHKQLNQYMSSSGEIKHWLKISGYSVT